MLPRLGHASAFHAAWECASAFAAAAIAFAHGGWPARIGKGKLSRLAGQFGQSPRHFCAAIGLGAQLFA